MQPVTGNQELLGQPDDLFDTLKSLQSRRHLPPVHRWRPQRQGRIDIRIARDGTWYHEGRAFTRMALVRLFSSVLRREGDSYYLVTPQEKLAIEVEDAPFLAIDFVSRGLGPSREIGFRTTTNDVVFADPDHPIWVEQSAHNPRPYVHVRQGLNALIARSVYYPLMELAEEADGRLWLYSRGGRFDLGAVS